jgi:YhcH/YjgK/YiaL family protein
MILDSLAARAFAFLEQLPSNPAPGRHEIHGEEVFAFVQRHLTRPVAECHYEAHRKYIDVQYVQRGREIMYWAPLPLLTNVAMPFDEGKDAALFDLIPAGVPVRVTAGQFTIFFPEDGHVPSCAWDQPAEVLKAVVKVLV